MRVWSTLLLLVFFVPSLSADSKQFTEKFNVSSCSWSSTGRNDFFILEPGYQQILEGRDGKDSVRLVVTVLNETKTIGGVETRVVEENETHNGQTVEISRNYFAICKPANDIFYFGEAVDMYKNGKVTGHQGSWTAEANGAKAGLFMPSRPLIGARYYQEIAPKVAMDRVEIASDTESLATPAGTFHDCVKTDETTPLEPGAMEHKVFARGVGLVQDGKLALTKYGTVTAGK
jgi:hypothetical protein